MKLPAVLSRTSMTAYRAVGIAFVIVGVLLMLLAYNSQSGIDDIGATNDPVLQHKITMLEDERNLYLVTSVGALFVGLFAIAVLGEPSLPRIISQSEMISTAIMANEMTAGLSLKGNAVHLPAKHGLSRQRILISAIGTSAEPPKALSDDMVMSPGKDGSTPGMLLEPLGLRLLDSIEEDLGTKLEGTGIESAEGSLQILKQGLGIIRDFHFKEREGKWVLRVEYSGLLDACRTVRKEKPDTCRQMCCIGCSCLLSAAARATGKVAKIEEVDNKNDMVEFTFTLDEW